MKNHIGVMTASLRMDLHQAIKEAARLGVSGVQLSVGSSDQDLLQWSPQARWELLKWIEDHGLEVSALCGPLGKQGLTQKQERSQVYERARRVLDLCLELGTNIYTSHIGVVPADATQPRYQIMQETGQGLANIAQQMGGVFAIETGPESTQVLREFLDGIDGPGMGVNFDPANLVMVTGDDPIQGVLTLKDYIVHTHIKDGVRLKSGDPELIYGFFHDGGIEDLRLSDFFQETPLGEGNVDFPAFIQALSTIGFDGYLTIEREVGPDPVGDISLAVQFLKRLMR